MFARRCLLLSCFVWLLLLEPATLSLAAFVVTVPRYQITQSYCRAAQLKPLLGLHEAKGPNEEAIPDESPSMSPMHQDGDTEDLAFKYYNRDVAADNDEAVVTREMLWRDLLEDPKVKRKKNKNRYKTLDNRDSLPFVVKLVTPDPYTHPKKQRKEALWNTQQHRKKLSRSKLERKTQPVDLTLGITSPSSQRIAASLYTKNDDGSVQRILGEFQLDKSTNCGDMLEVGDQEFEVQTARCQYKYAGGKRFVMVRKILEVKEASRVAEESYLHRQFQKGERLREDPPQLE